MHSHTYKVHTKPTYRPPPTLSSGCGGLKGIFLVRDRTQNFWSSIVAARIRSSFAEFTSKLTKTGSY